MTVTHIPSNPEVFRRNPKLGIGLGLVLLGIAVCGFYFEYSDYRSLGNEPQVMTIEQAAPSPAAVPDGPRWVQLSENLIPDCNLALQETSNGSVTGTSILASDGSRQRWVYMRMKGTAVCDQSGMPAQGILRKADPGLPAWLKEKGVNVPSSAYPLLEISVGEDPGSVKMLLYAFAGIGILGLITIIVFFGMSQKPASRPLARGVGAGR